MRIGKFWMGRVMEGEGEGLGGGGGVGPDVSAMIGADLAAAGGTASTTNEPAVMEALPGPEPTPVSMQEGGGTSQTQGEPEPEPEQVDPQAQQAQQPAAATEPEPDSEGLKPEGVEVSDSRWQRMVAHNRYAREVAKALGVVAEDDTAPLDVTSLPAAAEIRSAFDSRAALEAMEADFTSPDPAHTRNLIQQWNQISPEGMQRMAAEMPATLAQMAPQAYQALATPVIQRFIDYMYDAAGSEARPEIQRAILHGAQLAEWWATGGPQNGTYRSAEDIQRAAESRQNDPLATERAKLAAERQQLDQIKAEQSKAEVDGWRTGTNSAIDQAIDARVEQDLAPLKATSTESHYQAIKNEFIRQIHARVQSNPNSVRSFNLHYERALRGEYRTNPSVRDALVGEYARMASAAANALKSKFVTDQSRAQVAANAARHAQLQQSSAKVGPTAPARPVRQDMTPAVTGPRPGETHSDFMQRMVQQDWQTRAA